MRTHDAGRERTRGRARGRYGPESLLLSECDSAPDARLTKGVPVPMQSVSEVAYRPTFV